MVIFISCLRCSAALFLALLLCKLGDNSCLVQLFGSTAIPSSSLTQKWAYRADGQAARLAIAYRLDLNWALFLVNTTKKEALAHQLPHSLILAVIAQESVFDPKAESSAGAVSLMQVIPKWHPEKFSSTESIWEPTVNIRVGTAVLSEYIDRHRTLRDALQQYNGNRRDTTYRYARKIEKHQEKIEGLL